MSKRIEDVVARRLDILEKIAYQRSELADISLQLQNPLTLVDTGLKGVRFVRTHPVLMAGAVAALLAMKRIGIIGWIQKGWGLMSLYPVFLSMGSKLLSLTHSPREVKADTES